MAEKAKAIIRFTCSRCRAVLRVPEKLANRYIECPKCKNRIPVPESQAEADAEGKPYEVNETVYDVGNKCNQCGAKLKKGSVLCVKCGFDYRAGKVIETVDRTKRVGDDVTYQKIFNAPLDKEVGTMTTNLVGMILPLTIAASVIYFLPAIAQYAYTWIDEEGMSERASRLVMIGCMVINLLTVIPVMLGFWFSTMVAACSKTALGSITSTRGIVIQTVLASLIHLVGSGPLVLALFFANRHWMGSEDWSLPAPLVLGLGFAFAWWWIYITASVGAYAVDASLNPLASAYWFGRSFLDLMVLTGYFVLLGGLVMGPVVGFMGYMISLYADDAFMVGTIKMMLFVTTEILYLYLGIGFFSALGLVFRKNSEW